MDALSWRWVFGINVVPLAVTLYLTTRLASEDRSAATRERGSEDFGGRRSARIDVVGAVLCAVGLSAAVYALIGQQRLGPSHPAVLAGFVLGVACLVAFPWWERRAQNPIMPLELFAARNFAVGNLATVFLYAAVSLGTLAGRHGPRVYMAVGLLIAAGGFLLLTTARAPFDFWTQMLPGLVVFGVGLSVTVSPLTAAVLAAVDPAQSGIGSAVNNAVSPVAGLIAVAFTGVIVSLGQSGDVLASTAMDFAGFRCGAVAVAVSAGV